MQRVSQTLSNGNTIHYKIVDGTAYHEETPDQVVRLLESALKSFRGTRLRFCFGDTKTGRDWEEKYDVCGYIGRSSGDIKIPLLINQSASTGGGAILDHCIVRIESKGQNDKSYTEVYRHPKYHKES
jgi:hypothetical protein